MRVFAMAVAAFLAMAAVAARADDQPVVVELFTSQGCSSCPPADRLMGEIASRDDVIGLALHVDYWDYIGWKDRFARPDFTNRQREYARASGHRTVYTPQMIVGGTENVVGFKPMKLAESIARATTAPHDVSVQIRRSGDRVQIRATNAGPATGRLVVFAAQYDPSETVAIKRGENAGKTITYHNIVIDLDAVGTWNGRGQWSGEARVNPALPVAVFIQRDGYGPILAAARLR